jgi:hypothetical protein
MGTFTVLSQQISLVQIKLHCIFSLAVEKPAGNSNSIPLADFTQF